MKKTKLFVAAIAMLAFGICFSGCNDVTGGTVNSGGTSGTENSGGTTGTDSEKENPSEAQWTETTELKLEAGTYDYVGEASDFVMGESYAGAERWDSESKSVLVVEGTDADSNVKLTLQSQNYTFHYASKEAYEASKKRASETSGPNAMVFDDDKQIATMAGTISSESATSTTKYSEFTSSVTDGIAGAFTNNSYGTLVVKIYSAGGNYKIEFESSLNGKTTVRGKYTITRR